MSLPTARNTLNAGYVRSVCVSPCGKRIISGSDDKTIKMWDIETGACIRTLKGHSGYVFSVCVSPCGKRIISGSYDETIKMWDIDTGACIRTLEGHTGCVNSVCVSPCGKRIISGSNDKTIKIWDIDTGACIRTLEGHTDWVRSVCVSPCGKRIVSGGGDMFGNNPELKLWDLEAGECLRDLKGHSLAVRSVCVSPCGKRIISGSNDRTIKMWDIETGACIRTLEGCVSPASIMSVCVSPCGKRIISSSDDMTIKIWELELIEMQTLGIPTMVEYLAFRESGKLEDCRQLGFTKKADFDDCKKVGCCTKADYEAFRSSGDYDECKRLGLTKWELTTSRLPKSLCGDEATTFVPPAQRPRGADLKQLLSARMDTINVEHRTWGPNDLHLVAGMSDTVRQYYQDLSTDAKNYIDLLTQQLDERRAEHKVVYSNTLRGIKRETGYTFYASRSAELSAETARMREGDGRLVQRMAPSLFESYNHAVARKAQYDGFFDQVAKKSGGAYTAVSLKHVYRSLEKMFLQGDDPRAQATVLDIVRGLLEFDSMEKMQKALEYMFACDNRFPEGQRGGAYFAAAGNLPRVHVWRVKDRMAKPTSGGWADAMINFSFAEDPNAHVCEIQFAHERMITDRKEGGAHHGYGIYRAAFEILESINELPASELVSSHEKGDSDTDAIGGRGDPAFSGEMEALKSEVAVLKDKIGTQDTKIAEQDTKIAEQDTKIAELENQLKAVLSILGQPPPPHQPTKASLALNNFQSRLDVVEAALKYS